MRFLQSTCELPQPSFLGPVVYQNIFSLSLPYLAFPANNFSLNLSFNWLRMSLRVSSFLSILYTLFSISASRTASEHVSAISSNLCVSLAVIDIICLIHDSMCFAPKVKDIDFDAM